MLITTISAVSGFILHQADRSPGTPASPSAATATEGTGPLPADRAGMIHRAIGQASRIIIFALLDITLALWIAVVANQLARWAGVSFLKADYIGMGAMLASIPFVLFATIRVGRAVMGKKQVGGEPIAEKD